MHLVLHGRNKTDTCTQGWNEPNPDAPCADHGQQCSCAASENGDSTKVTFGLRLKLSYTRCTVTDCECSGGDLLQGKPLGEATEDSQEDFNTFKEDETVQRLEVHTDTSCHENLTSCLCVQKERDASNGEPVTADHDYMVAMSAQSKDMTDGQTSISCTASNFFPGDQPSTTAVQQFFGTLSGKLVESFQVSSDTQCNCDRQASWGKRHFTGFVFNFNYEASQASFLASTNLLPKKLKVDICKHVTKLLSLVPGLRHERFWRSCSSSWSAR